MAKVLDRIQSESEKESKCRGAQGGTLGPIGGVRRACLNGNWTRQNGERGVVQQDDSYPGNEVENRTYFF